MRIQVAVIFLTCVAITALFFTYAYFVYPPPGTTEGEAYIIPAVQLANKHIFNSPLFPPLLLDDSKVINPYPHANRMLYYPPLFPLSLGYAMGGHGSPERAFIFIALLNSAVISLSALLLYKAVTWGGRQITWFGTFCVVFGLLGIATHVYAEEGRPETLARLFVVLLGLTVFFAPKRYLWIPFGILLGFMGATHTIGGLMFGLIAAAVFAAYWDFKKALKLTLLTSLIGIAVFVVIVESGPYHVLETLQGVWANANVILSPAVKAQESISLAYIRDYYLFNPKTSFSGLLVVLAAFFAGAHFLKNKNRIASPALFSLWAGILTFFILGFLLYYVHLFYIVLFSPIIFAFVAYYAVRQKGFLLFASAVVIILTSVGFARSAVLFPFFIKEGISFNKAGDLLANETSVYGSEARVGITGPLWALFKDYDNLFIYRDYRNIITPPEGTTAILFQERFLGANTPPDIPNCNVKENYFTSQEVRIWNIKLANRVPGYAFALYECGTQEI